MVELQSWHPAKKFAPNVIGAANLKSIHADIENAFRMEMQDLVFQDGPARYLISLFKVAGRASREAGLNSVTINDDFSECADLRFFITNQVKLWLPEKIKDGIVNKLGRVSSTIPLDKCFACVLAFVRSQVRFNLYSLVWQKFIQLVKTVERGQLEGQEPALYLDEIQTPLAEIAEIELPIRTKDKWDRNCPADQEDKIQKLDLRENVPFISMIMGIASEGLLSGNRQQNINNRVEGYTRDYETWMDIWGTDLGKTLPDEVYKPLPPQGLSLVTW
uniref:Uncharacterized protein n=1 Tax=Chromera velia CCMP2878 TaxID=1169474 RepID=A0A0G4ICF1_9ALVE|eukprot:Cvel_13134.t1-p1 / transcript=Cvel_13134.t1 / gene=Cvel_13134 / organism=Chromera_velia_CCMP2878 / gene_product=hypothetical protein / transcript_product=hypothetical protein / location=Cvel_scaffold886:2134-2955(+) / protein_length=274 / sequence_SO=supercontig / SO=protein_coding / is_pseudo=false